MTITIRKLTALTCFLSSLLVFHSSYAAQITTTVYTTDKDHTTLGTITFKDSSHGMLVIPDLKGLTPGLHGFHLHQYASCEEAGMAAGGHFDPDKADTHQGPYTSGHLGDLPVLYVDSTGKANVTTIAPRLNTSSLQGLTIMVHEGGDNYSDHPKLGGGGARIGCGVIQVKK